MTALDFELTQEEAQVAGSRAAWRASLEGGLLARHLAPLTAFVLAVLFAAILGWTGLISRRAAEIALILSAAAYMVYRLWTRRRFVVARRAALAWAEGLRRPTRLTLDDAGLRLDTPPGEWLFADGLEVETVSGLVYVWPPRGWPLVWPSRIEGAEAFTEAARARSGKRRLKAPARATARASAPPRR